MQLNPSGTVPTLWVHDANQAKALMDSKDIIDWASKNGATADAFEKLAVQPDSQSEIWVKHFHDLPVRVISYGKTHNALARFMNNRRLAALRRQLKRAQDLTLIAAYRAKIADIESFKEAHTNSTTVETETRKAFSLLDRLDKLLRENTFISGDRYGLADLVWTVTVARFQMLGFSPLNDRPALARWYDQMHQRPSFEQADIWDRFRPKRVLPILLKKEWRVISVAALILALIIFSFVRVL